MIDFWRLVPSYWFQNDPTDKQWSKVLSAALDRHQPVKQTDCTCRIGPFTVWIANWPYAYGHLYEGRDKTGCPTVAVRRRIAKALKNRPTPFYVELANRLRE